MQEILIKKKIYKSLDPEEGLSINFEIIIHSIRIAWYNISGLTILLYIFYNQFYIKQYNVIVYFAFLVILSLWKLFRGSDWSKITLFCLYSLKEHNKWFISIMYLTRIHITTQNIYFTTIHITTYGTGTCTWTLNQIILRTNFHHSRYQIH